MSKKKFHCTSCGAVHSKWHGRCPDCREYNSIEEFTEQSFSPKKGGSLTSSFTPGFKRTANTLQTQDLSARTPPPPRSTTGIPEFDRALGGGIVEGSVVLIGGDPGIGKSTLLMQAAASMSDSRKVIYVSGEESLNQIQMRAQRLGVDQKDVGLIATGDCLAVADLIETLPSGSLVIIDSMQTMDAGADSAPGSVSQVKNSAAHLIPAAKNTGVSLLLVNHVTKDGTFAGPQVLIHAVDAALYIEADTSSGAYRIMRADKNRFGATDEIGIFEMTGNGMMSINNPSEVFISQRDPEAFGTVIFPSIEGTRPLLLEIQALISPSNFGTGRRSAIGWDSSRMNMVLATMSTRLGISLTDMDVYLNIAGGMKVTDPALDLAVVAAMLSAHAQVALPSNMVVFGEIGLAGEVRSASRAEARIKEAYQLGFDSIYCPLDRSGKKHSKGLNGINRIASLIVDIPQLSDALTAIHPPSRQFSPLTKRIYSQS
jgi:DNA repair protein RadA/Sms